MGERFEWVQIIEPKSKDIMYANLTTGDCVWEAPPGAIIKRADENQWWELFDVNTKRNYYYNAKTQRTVWQQPPDADIIPLAKLQIINENIESKNDQTIIIPTINHTVEQIITPSIITNKWKQISFQGFDITPKETKLRTSSPSLHSTTQRSIRRTATIIHPNTMISSSTTNDLTFSMNLNDTNPNKATYDNLIHSIHYPLNTKLNPHFIDDHYDNYPMILNPPQTLLEQSLNTKRSQSIQLKFPFSIQMTTDENNPTKYPFSSSSNILRHISTPSLELINNHNQTNLTRSSFGRNNIRKKQPRTNPNYVNIQIKTNDGTLRNTYIRLEDQQKCQTLTFSPSSEQNSVQYNSQTCLNESNETINNTDVLTNKNDGMMKQFITCTDEFLFHSTTDPLSLNFQQIKMINNGNNKINSNPSTTIHYDSHSNSSHSINRSHDTGSIDSSTSLTQSNLFNNKKNSQISLHKQSLSIKFPLIINEFESDMFNVNIHKRSLFSKNLRDDNLLSWSKESLTKPLLRTIDKILKKEAPDIFKLIQIYMGDKKSKQIASLNTCLELTTKGWSLPSIRDELYLQLIKQTTCNYNAQSLQRGWELMAICLSFFPPSNKFQILLERYILLQINGDVDTSEVQISIYAKVCQKRLEKILQTGPKKGLKKPTFEEIELSKHTIHFPSMFGATLEEVMIMQRTRYPERRLPWIQTTLSEEVLRLNGTQIEGIFRVPGDLDSVNSLKVKCDQWQYPSLEDAHLPASLLKLWYRELSEPLIPSIFYEQCISNCDKVELCLRLVNSLPDINRIVLTYLIRFLQIFSRSENVIITKMDVNNLSMVFAPNILRCDSDDAKVIFENARKEMLFIKILILNLDTKSIEGVI